MDYMVDLKAYYETHLLQRFGPPVGSPSHEIANLELRLGVALPAAFRDYLRWMGGDHHGVLKAAKCYQRDLESNGELLPHLLQVNKVHWKLTGRRLVFFSYQDYMAAWFDLPATEDNPVVTIYSEGLNGNRPKQSQRLSRFLYSQMVSMATLVR